MENSGKSMPQQYPYAIENDEHLPQGNQKHLITPHGRRPQTHTDNEKTFGPPTGNKVQFSISHDSCKPHLTFTRKESILKSFDVTQNYVLDSDKVLHESLVLASHLYWSLQSVFQNVEAEDGGKRTVSTVEFLAKPPHNDEGLPLNYEFSPMRFAPNREFLRNGCPTFNRLNKIPQIDFPSKAPTNTAETEAENGLDTIKDIAAAGDSASTTTVLEKQFIVPESRRIDLEPHAYLKQSYFPHQRASALNKKPAATKHKVFLVMQAENLDQADIKEYLAGIYKINKIRRKDVEITALEHPGSSTTCKIIFPSGNMARKFKSHMDKIKVKAGCHAQMCEEAEDSELVQQSLNEHMKLLVKDSSDTLALHQAKQKEIEAKLAKLQGKKENLSEIDRILEERQALQQKQQELENQEQEYISFMKIFQEQFLSVRPSAHWKKEAAALENRYQIEKERLQSALPMYSKRTEIIKMIAENQVSILLGETGSGKSTQVTQYLYEAGLAGQKKIVCTQPRKVAATSLAKRVSEEMHCHLGDTVGFKVGMQKQMSKETRILYVTDHMLLKECLDDPLLTKYSCVIIDEAHERSLNTDLLLGMIKRGLIDRPDLRVIITSATINPDAFRSFFCGCPVLRVSGRVFPVEVIYCKDSIDPDSNYVQRAVDTAEEVALQNEPGDILVFLTTPLETEQACEKMNKAWPSDKNKILCLALHGKTQSTDQQKVFNPTPDGKRKIVFATNSAETSVTIPGIKVVIDTGLAKEKLYDHTKNMSTLKVTKISQSSADQRKGRAGRIETGKCYRLYTEDDYASMDSSSKPEIMKVHLGMALLRLLSFKIEDPLSFDFVEMPPRVGLEKAMDVLIYLEAVDKDGHLTPLGEKLAAMSVEPRMAKLVLNGIDNDIGFECVLIASFSSMGGNMFYRGGSESEKQQADKLKVRFCNLQGDMNTMIDVYKEWNSQPEKQKNKWCMDNSINAKSMRMVRDSVKDIQDTLSGDLGIKVHHKFQQNIEHMEITIEAVMLESYAMNLCIFTGHESLGYMMVTDLEKPVHVHPSSALKPLAKSPRYMVYENTLTTSRAFVINITCVSNDTFQKFCQRGNPPIDMDEINKKIVSPVAISDIGPTIVKKVCGPRHRTRLALQKELQAYFHTEMLTVEAKVEDGTVSIYTLPAVSDECHKLVKRMIVKEQECLLQEEIERSFEEGCATRAILGHGGETKHLLFADEFCTLHIQSVPPKYSTEELVEQFRELAVVTDYEGYKLKNDRRELKVGFGHPDAAEEVLKLLEDVSILPGVVAEPDLPGAKGMRNPVMQNVSMKITWCRRRNKGIAFVKFSPCDPHSASGAMRNMFQVIVDGQHCSVQLSRKNSEELYVRNIPTGLSSNQVSNEIKDNIKMQTGYDPTIVVVPSAPPFETNQSDFNQFKKCIEAQIQHKAPHVSGVDVSMKIPHDKAVQYVAFVNMKNELDADLIQQALNGMTIQGVVTQVYVTLKTSVLVRQEIYCYIQDELLSITDKLKEDIAGLSCHGEHLKKAQHLKKGPDMYRIEISARSAADLTEARTQIKKCLDGERIDIAKVQHLQYFKSTTKGQQFLQRIQQDCPVLVTLDQYQSVFILHGTQTEVREVTKQIMKKINDLMNSQTKTYDLKEQYPVGMIKRLMGQYGLDLQGLADASGVEMIDSQLRHHKLTIHGTLEAITNAETLLQLQAAALTEKKKEMKQQSLPECPVCFCEVEVESNDMYRLEYCGHVYCESCIKSLLEHGAKDKSFPIQCAKEGCNKDIVVKDILQLVGTSMDQQSPFIKASVDGYVLTHRDELKYCITPGCNMVHRVDRRDMEVCSLCHVKICTLCDSEYHPSISCEMNKKMKGKLKWETSDERSKEVWLEEDRKNRALCPNCKNGIEKNKGCMHVYCIQCKTHICWNCKATFQTSDKTYDHLVKNHRAIFNLEDL